MRKVLIPVAAAAACAFCGLVLAVGCVVSYGGDVATSLGLGEQATRNEARPLDLAEGGRLEVALASGDVVVRAGGADAPALAAVVTGYGKDEAAARKALDDTRLVVEAIPGGVRVRLAGEPVEGTGAGLRAVARPRADLELRVPRDVALAVDLGSGGIRTHGPIGSSRLKSSYGDVAVETAHGDLHLESGSGKVELGGLQGANELDVRSGYGDVLARAIEARSVRISSSSGDVRLEDATCARAELESSYGTVVLRRVGGEVAAKTSSGDLQAEDLTGASAKLSSGNGDVRLRRFRGALEATTSSGSVSVSEFAGTCALHSGYGDVGVEGELTRVEGRSSSGSVRVRALPGSRVEDDWKLVSGYGDVALVLPADVGFELQAKTGYGSLDVQVPVLVPSGGLKHEHSIRGQVGAGGKRIVLETSSGDVRVATRD